MSLKNCKIIGDKIPYEVYSRQGEGIKRGHQDFCLSRSEIVAFFECPEKWLAGMPDDGDTEATRFGKLLEAIETGVKFSSVFALEPPTYRTAKKDEEKEWDYRSPVCREWRAEKEKAGLTVISPEELADATLAAKLCHDFSARQELMASSQKQVMVIGTWKDGDIEIPLRCLIDLLPDKNHERWGKYLGDGKTSRNGNPARWARECDDNAYDVQAALSLDLYVGATGEDRCAWVHPLSENQPPFHVVKPMPELSTEFIEWGRNKYQTALKLYAQCLRTNHWPSYPPIGMVLNQGATQVIDPKEVWEYKKTGGQLTKFQDYRPQPISTQGL